MLLDTLSSILAIKSSHIKSKWTRLRYIHILKKIVNNINRKMHGKKFFPPINSYEIFSGSIKVYTPFEFAQEYNEFLRLKRVCNGNVHPLFQQNIKWLAVPDTHTGDIAHIPIIYEDYIEMLVKKLVSLIKKNYKGRLNINKRGIFSIADIIYNKTEKGVVPFDFKPHISSLLTKELCLIFNLLHISEDIGADIIISYPVVFQAIYNENPSRTPALSVMLSNINPAVILKEPDFPTNKVVIIKVLGIPLFTSSFQEENLYYLDSQMPVFIELIPLRNGRYSVYDVLPLWEAETGKKYLIVVSSIAGHLRIISGKVVEFHSLSPPLCSIESLSTTLNQFEEMLSVNHIARAIREASFKMGSTVNSYHVFNCKTSKEKKPSLKVFLSTNNYDIDTEKFAIFFDEKLCEINPFYSFARSIYYEMPVVYNLKSASIVEWTSLPVISSDVKAFNKLMEFVKNY